MAFERNEAAAAAGTAPGEQAMSLLAQAVEAILPAAVSASDDSHKFINRGKLAALLVVAVQELTGRNAALEARIADIEPGLK